MATPDVQLNWSRDYNVTTYSRTQLSGDKIILPISALEQLLAASSPSRTTSIQSITDFDPYYQYSLNNIQTPNIHDKYQQLPQPLTFLLINTRNGKKVHAGIQEFSAKEGEIVLSPFLLEALNISSFNHGKTQNAYGDVQDDMKDRNLMKNEIPRVEVHAKQLPKGVFLRLRPLEAGYNPTDWKSLLEKFLRENFTTLTRGETLTVQAPRSEEFKFLIDKLCPDGDGICVIDTDLEVDIESLNEEQARETLNKILSSSYQAGNDPRASTVNELDIWKSFSGKVKEGEYIDYTLPSWDRSQGVAVEVRGQNVELFISPFCPRNRNRPRDDEHVWGSFEVEPVKRIIINPPREEVEKMEALYISVHARGQGHKSYEFTIQARSLSQNESTKEFQIIKDRSDMHSKDDEQCKTCLKWLPKSTMVLHENFCRRNNVVCSLCHNVYQKKSEEWQEHWHCKYDTAYGNSSRDEKNHHEIYHTDRLCPNCPYRAKNIIDLANHRTTVCPGKIILCQFCHLEVPQEGDPDNPSLEALIYNLTPHELADGARTTQCHLCSKIIRLRDVSTHMKNHEFEKSKKTKPKICKNIYCCRTLNSIDKKGNTKQTMRLNQGPTNALGLCDICFGPLYVNMHDPDGKALKRRIERRYLSQLVSGCGKSWCRNQYCKTAQNLQFTSKTALPLIKPLISPDGLVKMYFCVDQENNSSRAMAEEIASEKIYDLEWCVAALEQQGNLDRAQTWLVNWAPKIDKKSR